MSDISPSDLDRYREILRPLDMPEAESDELIQIVCRIMRDFVDRAFGIDPVQLSLSNEKNKASVESTCHDRLSEIPQNKYPILPFLVDEDEIHIEGEGHGKNDE